MSCEDTLMAMPQSEAKVLVMRECEGRKGMGTKLHRLAGTSYHCQASNNSQGRKTQIFMQIRGIQVYHLYHSRKYRGTSRKARAMQHMLCDEFYASPRSC